jgi:predicted 2-oxoglutarate/Fe(II)-dependent dioxygenase YbiX
LQQVRHGVPPACDRSTRSLVPPAQHQPRRDNTTRGTAHRRFALSVNLNDGFDGGELCLPEYGSRTYKPPAGCAVVFSGALLHQVTPVRSGRRYAFLPFLYDEAAAALREQNNAFLGGETAPYERSVPP